jgi:apolipoprotein N-acyltransferase
VRPIRSAHVGVAPTSAVPRAARNAPSFSARALSTASAASLSLRLVRRVPFLDRAVSLAAGGGLVLAFAPFEWRSMAVISPALLFLLWIGASARRAFQLGYLFGLGLFGAGVSWIYFSLHLFGAAIAPLAALITLFFVLAMALYPALLGWGVARLRTGRDWANLMLIMPAGWVVFEWWRGWFLTGFPWLLLGHAQPETWLAGYAPVVGAYGVGWAAAVSAGVLAWTLTGDLRRLAAGPILLLALWLGGAALSRVEWTVPEGPALRVSLLQGNVAQETKWKPESLFMAMDLYARLNREALGSDLILWPETAIPAFYHEVAEHYLLPLSEETRAHGGALLVGIFVYEPGTRHMYNSIVHVDEWPSAYHKRHLVPFGEYLPLRGLLMWLDSLLEIPMSDLTPGRGRPLLDVAGLPVGFSVCYEDAFGEQMIDALPEARMLVNVSNDAWFGDSIAPHQHLEIARMRSLESGRVMLRATNTGISAVIGHRGEIIARSPQFEEHVLTAQAQPRTGLTPYARWGNTPVVLLAMLVVALGGVVGRKATVTG